MAAAAQHVTAQFLTELAPTDAVPLTTAGGVMQCFKEATLQTVLSQVEENGQ